ncbi:zinc ABC transporter substrate-binding protein [uncultured Jannaschia sp.]|uniref:zinc ABC transporter substrate-binding protein n=1 Tax=uncultured Jannaschia sp. TaxID=293347 RepID=UPI0026232A2C|nr:zinc ABC transporter substrate-binding protein [uncultured Jannaschia sp.]
MMRALVLSLVAMPAWAEPPHVVTDIAPVHSLVARVMDGVGTPDLILPQGGSPHDYSLRPSQAGALESADAVVWIGRELTPWLADALEALSEEGASLELLDVPGTRLIEGHDHGDHGDHAEHADEGHDDHGHDDHGHDDHGHDDHASDEGGHEVHDHGGLDPHGWLDPENGILWIDAIAARLSALDPENAVIYAANAEAGRAEITDAARKISTRLDALPDRGFVVFHDGYGPFEAAFDRPAFGAIARGDAADPGAAHIAELRAAIADESVICVFGEAQANSGLVDTVIEGSDARTAVLDPLGMQQALGPDLYVKTLTALANSIASCLES